MQGFLLLIPTGIAAVMICWVVVGTHVQALVRHGGAVISIPAGIVVTGILFGIAMLVMVPVQRSPDLLTLYLGAGMLMAVFFFAVRDIYATSIAVTGCMVFLFSSGIHPEDISAVLPWMYAAAIATAGVPWESTGIFPGVSSQYNFLRSKPTSCRRRSYHDQMVWRK